ncbi:hypothetical protein PR048_010894 [Dryococelus australis]|uniref:Uncharacterized protein n=1 Tax=Dryococelus australis TaxID=614101 RepID=A0ABQ9I3Z8_9NEOP|nr:hypothetical protein PR048_010894 [Dryococelus australis]
MCFLHLLLHLHQIYDHILVDSLWEMLCPSLRQPCQALLLENTVLLKNKTKMWDTEDDEAERIAKDFYCKDTIIRPTPGCKDSKSVKNQMTGEQQLVQKRYMVMTVLEAFNIFRAEYPTVNVHKFKFYELCPQHVLLCSETPHNVCVCMYLEFLRAVYCETKSETYMSNLCAECKNVYDLIPDNSETQCVAWPQWSIIDGRPKLTQDSGTVMNAAELLQGKLKHFKTHCFIKVIQEEHFENMKTNTGNSISPLVPPTSDHFTGCVWVAGRTTCYAVISDSLNHDKYTLYAFVKQILKVMIFSDGAAAQFKNMYTLSNLCFVKEYLFMDCEWNFLSTSHRCG